MPLEFTPPAILRKFHQTGKVPDSMLPLGGFGETPEDPAKPLRGSFEAILLARSANRALQGFTKFFGYQKNNPNVTGVMYSIEEVDEEVGLDTRIELLKNKKTFVIESFNRHLTEALSTELSKANRGNLPPSVAFAYGKLTEINNVDEQVYGIMSAAVTLETINTDLFRISGFGYPRVLNYDPTAREMVDLAVNSYESYVHPQTGIHNEVNIGVNGYLTANILGKTYSIDIATTPHKVVLIDPSQYHRVEKEMRGKGDLKDQKIHCPFAMSSQFTAPFLDEPTQAASTNPLQHAFQTLVRDYIGA